MSETFGMMKKTTAKLIILFAGIFLLLHAVVPHVHFKSEIVITASPDHQTQKKHNHDCPEQDNENTLDYCILKQVFFNRSNNTNPEVFNLNRDYSKDNQKELLAISQLSSAQFYIPDFYTILEIPHVLQYSQQAGDNINSRGSPIV